MPAVLVRVVSREAPSPSTRAWKYGEGQLVHDVLEHLHARLPQEGMERVTPENLPRAQELLREVFDETLAEHASKRGNEVRLCRSLR